MTELEARKAWNHAMHNVGVRRTMSRPARNFVTLMAERNWQIIQELEEADRPEAKAALLSSTSLGAIMRRFGL